MLLGDDLQRLVEQPDGVPFVARDAEHLALDLKGFGRARVAAMTSSISLSASQVFVPLNSRASSIFGLAALGSSLTASSSRVSALARSPQTRGHCTERRPDLALEGRIPIARLYQVHEVGEFPLAEQGVNQHRQVIGLVALKFAGGTGLALGRWGIAELQIHLSKTRSQNGILRRNADRVAQLDFVGPEISLYDMILVCLLRLVGRGFGVCSHPGECGKSTGDNYRAHRLRFLAPGIGLPFFRKAAITYPSPIWCGCIWS
jgi:hypothetical protein